MWQALTPPASSRSALPLGTAVDSVRATSSAASGRAARRDGATSAGQARPGKVARAVAAASLSESETASVSESLGSSTSEEELDAENTRRGVRQTQCAREEGGSAEDTPPDPKRAKRDAPQRHARGALSRARASRPLAARGLGSRTARSGATVHSPDQSNGPAQELRDGDVDVSNEESDNGLHALRVRL